MADYGWDPSVPEPIKQAWLDTIDQSKFKFDRVGAQLNMAYTSQPRPAGSPHLFDLSYEQLSPHPGDNVWTVVLRDSDSISPLYFGDQVMHTVGHVVWSQFYDLTVDPTAPTTLPEQRAMYDQWGSWFEGHWPTIPGAGVVRGNYTDFRPAYVGNYADDIYTVYMVRIEEALAEFFKDVFRSPRHADNDTIWQMQTDSFYYWTQQLNTVLCPRPVADS